jgi:hypothetical protein
MQKRDYPVSDSYKAIVAVKQKLAPKYWDIFEILAISIFETPLVKELIEYFNTPGLHPSIRHYINDHMNDESRHYGYFHKLLAYTWANMPADYQEQIGGVLAEFIVLYLNITSEKEFNLELLNELMPGNQQIIASINNLYQGFNLSAEIPIVKNVINVMEQVGILGHYGVKKSFLEFKLL